MITGFLRALRRLSPVGWRLIPLVIFVSLVFFFWRGLRLEPHNLPSALIGRTLPAFQLPALGGRLDRSFSDQDLHGHIALLHVFASWCSACRDEQVFLLQLAREGVLIYGLNYKDDVQDVRRWLAQWGNPYRRIGHDSRGKVGLALGVYGAPETFLIDNQGVIQYRHAGPLHDTIWQQEFVPRIHRLEQDYATH